MGDWRLSALGVYGRSTLLLLYLNSNNFDNLKGNERIGVFWGVTVDNRRGMPYVPVPVC